MRMCALVNRAF